MQWLIYRQWKGSNLYFEYEDKGMSVKAKTGRY